MFAASAVLLVMPETTIFLDYTYCDFTCFDLTYVDTSKLVGAAGCLAGGTSDDRYTRHRNTSYLRHQVQPEPIGQHQLPLGGSAQSQRVEAAVVVGGGADICKVPPTPVVP